MIRSKRKRRGLAAAILITLGLCAATGACNNPGGPHNTWNVVHPLNVR